ncbi:MAG: nucleoside hydrolase, partial [Bacillota bacterium]
LKKFGYEDIKIYKGSNKPIKYDLNEAKHIHGDNGLSNLLENIEVNDNSFGDAFEFLEKSIKKYRKDLTLILTGPQTNLAKLLKNKPYLSKLIGKVIIMGGAINKKGNRTLTSEYNIYVDPHAAFNVFHSNIKDINLISLDVTHKALLSHNDIDKIKNNNLSDFLIKLTSEYMDMQEIKKGKRAFIMHDPLTVLYCIDENILKTSKKYVTVERTGEFTRGMTICDNNNRLNKKKNINISIDINQKLYKNLLIKTFNNF